MSLITWTERFSVGIESIDHQHRTLVDLLNSLHDDMQTRGDEIELDPVFEELIEYIKQHFNYEESLMERHDFPGLEEHRQLHAEFRQKVARYYNKYLAGDPLPKDLLPFLMDWVRDHILGKDHEYSTFLRKQGIE